MSYAQAHTENTNHDISPSRDDIPPTETDSSFVNLFARSRLSKRTFFPTDQEVYLDSSSPLILLNDTTIQAPFRGHYQGPLTTDRRDLSSNILLEGESPTKRENSDKKEESFTDRRRRTLKSESRGDRRTSKALSNGTSNSRSDIGGTSKGNGNDRLEFEPDSSPSKSMVQSDTTPEDQVDVFGVEEKKKEINRFQKWLIHKLDSKWFNVIIAICTIYALFAQDICQAFLNSTTDLGFDIVSMVTIVIFSIEIVLTCYAKREYIGSFFFVLDVLSTASIFLDIDFVAGSLFSGGSVESVEEASKSSNQASNIATRAGGIMRVVRLMRLVKLYKQITHEKAIEQQQQVQNPNLLPQNTIKSQQSMRKIVPEELASPSILDRKSTFSPAPSPFKKARADSSTFDFNKLATLNAPTAHHTKPRASIITLNALSNNNDPDGLGEIPRNKSLDQSRISHRPSGMAPMITGEDIIKHSERHSESQSQSRRARRFSKLSLGSQVNPNAQNQAAPEVVKESRVGKRLSDLTMKRVIVMVLGLLLFIPMFSSDFWNTGHSSQVYQIGEIGKLIDNAVKKETIEAAVDSFKKQQEESSGNTPVLLYLRTKSKVWYDDKTIDRSKLRDTETQTIYMETKHDGTLLSIVSMKHSTTFDSRLSLGRTFFICILLTFGAYYFSKDARTLILDPLERMIEKVNRIARNPLAAKNEKLVIDNQGFENETIHIENAIVKIGGLLALGFGDAGSAIIGQNITKSGGDINPMLPGKKKAAIYGFCDIRNFTDATEILQEDVMVFVNSIAEVVHSVTDKFLGAANKNIGDAFLLVWKIPDESVTEILDGQLEISTNKSSQNIADCALISFLKIYAKINREPVLLKYRENEKLNARLPNYKVKMGFGLHVGWAIEGAIGSEFKIDASYLSPNVNMASRLEAATKQYGVPLLFSGDLYEMLSDHLQDKSRMIDIVTVKGSIKPIELYTVDMDVEDISIAKDKTLIPKDLRRDRQIQKRVHIKDLIDAGEVYTLLETDKELVHGLRNYNENFEKVFSEGFNAYIDGDWSVAKKKFEQCLAIRADDGPTKNLMNFLGEYQFMSPEDWDGYHVLTEK